MSTCHVTTVDAVTDAQTGLPVARCYILTEGAFAMGGNMLIQLAAGTRAITVSILILYMYESLAIDTNLTSITQSNHCVVSVTTFSQLCLVRRYCC